MKLPQIIVLCTVHTKLKPINPCSHWQETLHTWAVPLQSMGWLIQEKDWGIRQPKCVNSLYSLLPAWKRKNRTQSWDRCKTLQWLVTQNLHLHISFVGCPSVQTPHFPCYLSSKLLAPLSWLTCVPSVPLPYISGHCQGHKFLFLTLNICNPW